MWTLWNDVRVRMKDEEINNFIYLMCITKWKVALWMKVTCNTLLHTTPTTLLSYTTPYSPTLHYTLLHYTTVSYTTLFYTILHSNIRDR